MLSPSIKRSITDYLTISARAKSSVFTATFKYRTSITPVQSQYYSMAGHNGTLLKLNTGAQIPAIGFGTWNDKDAQEEAVLKALKAGYRHIDTARIYGTERAVGAAIKQSGVPRSEIFLVTKLWNNSHSKGDVEKALDASLTDLGTDYVDLYLMHWPGAFKAGDVLTPRDDNGKAIAADTDYVEAWKGMEGVFKSGKAKAIGVSNFSQAEMERLLKETDVVPAAHQMELHPYLQQRKFTDWHKSKGIHVTHYSPLGNANEIYDKGKAIPKIIENPKLVEIGKKYGKTGAQVALAWGIARGHSVIPKSKTEHRIQQNLEGDFELKAEDVEEIGKLDKAMRFNDPSASFSYNCFTDLEGKA